MAFIKREEEEEAFLTLCDYDVDRALLALACVSLTGGHGPPCPRNPPPRIVPRREGMVCTAST